MNKMLSRIAQKHDDVAKKQEKSEPIGSLFWYRNETQYAKPQ